MLLVVASFASLCVVLLTYCFDTSRMVGIQPTCLLTRLLRQTTGHMDIPSVQQQQIQPQSNQRTLTGIVLLSTLFTLVTVALYSSGATYKEHILTIYLITENINFSSFFSIQPFFSVLEISRMSFLNLPNHHSFQGIMIS